MLIPALNRLGVSIGTHIRRCAKIDDRAFESLESDIAMLNAAMFPVLDESAGARMAEAILNAKAECDSVGGITETAVCGLPAGLGEPWFDSVEGLLSHALFSLGGVKGVEFGEGFAIADARGSEANDPFRICDGKIVTTTNNNGGVNGGITNGMPVLFRCAVKPTPSIAREQQTVDFLNGENVSLTIAGRHDPAIVRRICPVINAVTALVVADLLSGRYGTDVFLKEAL